MNLIEVARVGRKKFKAANYNLTHRRDILLHFCRDELGLTAKTWQEIRETGITTANISALEGSDEARFFIWYFINYVVDRVADNC